MFEHIDNVFEITVFHVIGNEFLQVRRVNVEGFHRGI